jgi:Holliday junction resolvase-like predicted endonuclease
VSPIDITTDLIIELALGFLILLLVLKLIPVYYKKIKSRRRLNRGLVKEKEAYKVLKKLGFKIIGNNVKYNYPLQVDMDTVNVGLEIDYLVERKGKTFIIEVKTGESANKITNSSTRRQILEYSLFIKNNGIYLLDMETEKLQEIVYPLKFKNPPKPFPFFAFLILLVSLIGLVVFYFDIVQFDQQLIDQLNNQLE